MLPYFFKEPVMVQNLNRKYYFTNCTNSSKNQLLQLKWDSSPRVTDHWRC